MAPHSPSKKEQKWILNAIADLNTILGGVAPPNPLTYHNIYLGLLPNARLIVEKYPGSYDSQKVMNLVQIIESQAQTMLFQGGLITEYWVDES